MSDLLEKISSYNIFNYLLPGALFVAAADLYSSYRFTHDNVVVMAFLVYFIGLVISRIGSLIIEPVVNKTKLLAFAPYKDFIAACKNDDKIDILSEVNNMYRTLVSLCVCVFAFLGFDWLAQRYSFVGSSAPYVGGLALLVLFLWSWRKQTAYIVQRVNTSKDQPPKTVEGKKP